MIINQDAFKYLPTIKSGSIDLIVIDPPYDISRKSYFGAGKADNTKFNKMSHDFGYWDKEFDIDILFGQLYRVLKKGGTLIVFYDVWKTSIIKEIAEEHKFKQPRICQWIKNNPVPINSQRNYLSNAIEFFFSFVKDKKPTFNSKYDNGIYNYALCHGKERLDHPTQKPLGLIKEIIEKHSNEGDLVLDCFSGTATTAEACISINRRYICIERDEKYYQMSVDRIKQSQLKSI